MNTLLTKKPRNSASSNAPTMPAVIYTRISVHVEQDQDLQAQRVAIRQYAENKGYEVADEFSDLATGSSLDRPGLEQMFAYMEQTPCTVLVLSSDRLTRLSTDVAFLRERLADLGAELVVTSDSNV
jgi:DNA invertase Pin-like site-specific DNA recombinase